MDSLPTSPEPSWHTVSPPSRTESVGNPTNTENVVNGDISSDFEAKEPWNNLELADNNTAVGPTTEENPQNTTDDDKNTSESTGSLTLGHEEQCLQSTTAGSKSNVGRSPSDTENLVEPTLGQHPTTPPKATAPNPVPNNLRFCRVHNSRAHDHSECNAVKAMQAQGRPMPWELDVNWIHPHKRAASPMTAAPRHTNQSGDARNHVARAPEERPSSTSPVLPVFGPPLPAPHERRTNDRTPSPEKEVLGERDVRTNWRGKPVDAVATQRWVIFTKEQVSAKPKAILTEVPEDVEASPTGLDTPGTEHDHDGQSTTSICADTTSTELSNHSNALLDAVDPSPSPADIAFPASASTGSIAPPPAEPDGTRAVVVNIKGSLGLPIQVDLSKINNESVVVAVDMVDGMTVQIKVCRNSSITITKGVVA